MKKRSCIVLAVLLLAGNMRGEDLFEEFKEWLASFIVTETHLFLKFPPHEFSQQIIQKEKDLVRWLEPNEELVLTPDQQTEINDGRHAFRHFTPVTFKNKKKGFKIDSLYYEGDMFNITETAYLALSDTPIEVGETDVEMIMENGEWKKVTKEGGAKVSPSRNKAKTGKAIADDGQDEGRATASPASRLWLYALISFCALSAVFYFLRRKKARNSA